MKRYIGIYAKDIDDSHEYQKALFNVGFAWCTSGITLQKHTNFYARLEDMSLITCYHDASIDEESIKLTIQQIENKDWLLVINNQ